MQATKERNQARGQVGQVGTRNDDEKRARHVVGVHKTNALLGQLPLTRDLQLGENRTQAPKVGTKSPPA